jgi:hypothetical protein
MMKFLADIIDVLSVCFLNRLSSPSHETGSPIPDGKPVRTSIGALT